MSGASDASLNAEAAFKAGKINDETVQSAIDTGDHDFVARALALKAGLPPEMVQRVLAMQGAKSTTALVGRRA